MHEKLWLTLKSSMFCKPLRDKSRFKPLRRINDEFTFTEFEKAELVLRKDWGLIVPESEFFLDLNYLSLIESSRNTRLKTRYVIFYQHQQPCAVAYFQLIDFEAGVFGELIKQEVEQVQSKRMLLFEKYLDAKDKEDVLMRLLTCGNNLISGEYGYKKHPSLNETVFYQLLCTIIKTISSEDHLRGRLSAVLLKDFLKPLPFFEDPKNYKGKAFTVEPNMTIELPEGLIKLEDYVKAFSKKYRNRAKAILKNREHIEFRDLNEQQLKALRTELNGLYQNTFSKAKFKLLMLPENYFEEVKRIFNNQFQVKGLFVNNELKAFMSAFILEGESIEAHYIGLDYEANDVYELYQNMLYEFISLGIAYQCKQINLGRTAAEIKSTVGAKAQDLICYVQAQNPVSKLIVDPFIDFLKPKSWIPRNPFKEEQS
jgi:hypothetical protein